MGGSDHLQEGELPVDKEICSLQTEYRGNVFSTEIKVLEGDEIGDSE